jgi:dienelactone hydrolase
VIQVEYLLERKPVLLKRGTHRLFAVGTLPAAEPDGVGVVLLPGAATPAFGNSRIWNRVAHEAARAGSAVIQLDYTGAGESGDAEVSFPLGRPLVPDVLAAVRWLRDQSCRSFVLAGTCFGARSALAAGPDVPGLLGAVLLFPPVQMPLPDKAFEEALSRAVRAGVPCHFVYGERDVDHPRFVEFLAQTPAGAHDHVTVEIVPGRLHGIADADAFTAVYESAIRSISALKDRARHVKAVDPTKTHPGVTHATK